MERAVDAKLALYRGNPIVEKISEASKEHFRKGILKRAEEGKSRKLIRTRHASNETFNDARL